MCGPCQIVYGSRCIPCPKGSTLAECVNCGGQQREPWIDKKDVVSAVITGVITALVVSYVTKKVKV